MTLIPIDMAKPIQAVEISGKGELRVNRIHFCYFDETRTKIEIDQRYEFYRTEIKWQ
jgi:hypothetical protein